MRRLAVRLDLDQLVGFRIVRVCVVALDQQPLRSVAAAPALQSGAHQLPAATQFFTVQDEIEFAGCDGFQWIASGRPYAVVEHQHVAGTVIALRDLALETGVGQWMILDFDRKALLAYTQRRAFGHRPALERAIDFETKIIVACTGVVQLHDEDRPLQCRSG